MNESQYINLQVKKWRALTYNWDALWAQGDTSRLYCLTDFQVAWLLSNTEYMRWSSRWEDCPCTQNDLEAMKAELDFNLMSCIDIQPYQLQYLYQQASDEYFARLNALWDIDPTPSEINPSTPDNFYSGDDSPERVDALCTACKIYVYSYAQNWCTKAQIILGIVGVIGLFASITIVGGVVASVLIGGLAYITSLALDAMQDENALDDVACCMATTLEGLAITNANFEIALDSCSFIPGSNKAIVRDIIASDLNVFSNWLGFLDTLGKAYDLAVFGISDCPCGNTWEQTFIFDSTPPLDMFDVCVKGTWASPNWIGVNSVLGGSNWNKSLGLDIDLLSPTVIELIEVDINVTKGGATGGGATPILLFREVNCSGTAFYSPTVTQDSPGTYTWSGELTMTTFGIWLNSARATSSTPLNTSVCELSRITIQGRGINPFV